MDEKTLEKKFEEIGARPSIQGLLSTIIFGGATIDFAYRRLPQWNFDELSTYFELGAMVILGTIATIGGIAAYYDMKKSMTGEYPKNKILNKIIYETTKFLS